MCVEARRNRRHDGDMPAMLPQALGDQMANEQGMRRGHDTPFQYRARKNLASVFIDAAFPAYCLQPCLEPFEVATSHVGEHLSDPVNKQLNKLEAHKLKLFSKFPSIPN